MSSAEERPLSILVVRLGALGDVANVLRPVTALRRKIPEAFIGWAVEPRARGLVEAAGVADRIHDYPRKDLARLFARPWTWPKGASALLRVRRDLCKPGYDVALDFQGNFKGALVALLSGARDRVGFARGHTQDMSWVLNNVLAVPADKRLPRAEKYAALVQAVEPEIEMSRVELAPSPEDAAWVETFLRDAGGNGPLVVVHPGVSAFGAFKRWPAERFGEVCGRLTKERGARCLVTQGPGEESLAAAVAAAARGAARTVPVLSIRRLIELLRRADLMISGDTGPAHIAALLECPQVTVFGPKDPVMYAPYSPRCEVVRAEVDCGPCSRRTCHDLRCIHQVTVEMVLQAAEKLLDRQRRP